MTRSARETPPVQPPDFMVHRLTVAVTGLTPTGYDPDAEPAVRDLALSGARLVTRCRERPAQPPRTQYMCCPPLIESVEPVMKPMSSSTRNSTPLAISLACPSLPTGMVAMIFSSTFSGTARTMSVSM